VEVKESSICDLNTIRSEDKGEDGEREVDEEVATYPNW
jgi:hypothetical protein